MDHDTTTLKRRGRGSVRQAVVFRADADVATGTGHVMRCLALAQALREMEIPVFFIVAKEIPALGPRLRREGIGIISISAEPGSGDDAKLTIAAAGKKRASWIVTDGYRFREPYHAELKKAGFSLMCIDDGGLLGHYHADIVLNQNLYATRAMYTSIAPETHLLLGGRYALIRQEILAAQSTTKRAGNTPAHILVTLGGSDGENRTADVIHGIARTNAVSCEVRVIAGGFNPHVHELEALVNDAGRRFVLLHNVDDMAEQYRWADIAICGGGSTTLELAFLGIPMITVVLSENQVPVCDYLEQAGAAVNIGPAGKDVPEKIGDVLGRIIAFGQEREKLSENARKLVDGMGAFRTALFLCGDFIRLRKAIPEDCGLVYRWINEPYVRGQSFNPDPITLQEHDAWYHAKMQDPDVRYFIVGDRNGDPVGQVRYDIDGSDAVISILIAPEHRGKNFGTLAMIRSARVLFDETPVRTIHAYVKATNPYSCRAFINAGFTPEGTAIRNNQEAIHLVLRRP